MSIADSLENSRVRECRFGNGEAAAGRLRTAVMCFLLALASWGCAEPRRPSTGAERPVVLAMPEVQDLYWSYQKAEGKPPTRLADFDKFKLTFPRGYRAVQNGDIVVLWGAEPRDQAPLAYEKGTPENGGLVLFGDGNNKKVTAEEFKVLVP
jgi:hypothetical protein